MQTRFEHRGVVWVDLETPTREEVQKIAEEFSLEPLIAEELLLPSPRPRAEFSSKYIYTILHFPALRHTHKTREQEIDFVIGKKFLITTHYDTVDPLHKFSKVFEVGTVLDKTGLGDHAGFLFFYMLKQIYGSIEHEVEVVRRQLSDIEEHIYAEEEVEMVTAISRSARDLLNLRQTIEPHRDVLKELEMEGSKMFGDAFAPYLRALSNEYYRVHNHIMRHTEFLHELRETNNSLLTTKQNETMRVLTIMALLTFPLALFVAIIDVDAEHNPLNYVPYDFWFVVGVVLVSGLSMLTYFKYRKWL